MGWALISCGSPLTAGPNDDDTSPTPKPVPSHEPLDCKERQRELTSDREPDFTVMYESAQVRAMEQNITSEPELHMSEQVCEPAVSSIAVGVLLVYEGMEVNPAHTPATESEFLSTLCSVILISKRMILCPHYWHPNKSALLLFCWSHPATLSRLLSKSQTVCLPKSCHFVSVPLFLLSLFSSLQQPSPYCLTLAPQFFLSLLSVARQPVVSQLLLGMGIPWLCLRHQIPSFHLGLTPPPPLLPPSTPAATIRLSAPPGSLGPSAPPGSDISSKMPQTCGLSAALQPSIPPPLWLHLALPSLRLHLCPWLLQLHFSPPVSRFYLGLSSLRLCHGLRDFQCHSAPLALCLH